jgi:glycosyltransferase involved in cell wall biosynthesis
MISHSVSSERCSVLFVIDSMIRGGGPRVCYNLIRALPTTEFLPCLVTLFENGSFAEELEKEGIPCLCLQLQHPFYPTTLVRALPLIADFAREHRVQFIHAHLTAGGLYGGLVARQLGLPSIFTMHGELTKRLPLRWIESGVRRLFPVIVAVSKKVEAEAEHQGIRARVVQVSNGVDTNYWEPSERKTAGGLRIVMVANFFMEKDHVTAVEGFKIFLERFGDSRLLLVGEGEGKGEVERFVQRRGVRNVEFLGGVENVNELLSQVDIFLLSSKTEGISLAVIEGMAMGLPVIASDVGGMREILTDGVDGLLVPEGDPESLACALEQLAENSELREVLGARARIRIQEEFSLEAMASAYISLYTEQMGPKK